MTVQPTKCNQRRQWKTSSLHRNLLLACNDLPVEVEHIKPKKRTVKSAPPRVETCLDQGDNSDDDWDISTCVTVQHKASLGVPQHTDCSVPETSDLQPAMEEDVPEGRRPGSTIASRTCVTRVCCSEQICEPA